MNPLQRRLAALRRRLRVVVSLQGTCWLLAFLMGGVLLAGGLDWLASLPSLIRAFLLVAVLGGAGVLGYRFLVMPLWSRTDDLSLALRVEARYPILNDALASTVQFLEQPADSDLAGSPSLRREAVQQAMRRAQGCDFNKIVPSRGLVPAGLSFLACAGLALALMASVPTLAWTALFRLADPFGDHDWPTDTQLAVKFRQHMPAGQTFVVRGEVQGVIPKSAVIEFEGLDREKDAVKLPIQHDDGATTGTFEYTVEMSRQQGDFQFRITANDAASPKKQGTWHQVTVMQPPELTALTGRVEYPAYTDLPAEDLSEGFDSSAEKPLVLGTRLILHGVTDRAIARAFMYCEPSDPRELVTGAALVGLAAQTPLDSLSLWRGLLSVGEPVPARIEGDGTRFSLTLVPHLSGRYHLVWMDQDGLDQGRTINLRVKPDPAPEVQLECRSLAPKSRRVVANATLSLRVTARDEEYAVRSAALEYRRKDAEGNFLDDGWQSVPLYETLYDGLAALPFPLIKPVWRQQPKHVMIPRNWSIEGLVQVGQTLLLRAAADDFDNVTLHKQPGRSPVLELRIASPQDVKADIQKAIAEVRNELNRLNDLQTKALDKITAAQKQLQAAGKLRPKEIQDLLDALEQDKQAQERIGKDKSERLQKDVDRIRQALDANRLPRSAATDKMKSVARALQRIGEQLGASQDRVQTVLKDEEDAPGKRRPTDQRNQDMAKAQQHQKEAQDTLEGLLSDLIPFVTIQEMQGRAQQLRREQEDLLKETQRLQQERQRLLRQREQEPKQLRAEREKAAEKQRQLADKTRKLLREMDATSKDRQESNPNMSGMLKRAVQQGKDNQVADQMDQAADQLRGENKQEPNEDQAQFHRATQNQREAIKNLDKVIGAMDERREEELDRLTKKQKREQRELGRLRNQMDKLQKKVKQAQKIKNTQARRDALQKLAAEQQQLQKQVDEMVKRLSRIQAEEAAEELRRASQQMAEAARQMDNGDDPEKKQDDALARLNEAQRKLQQANNQVENELAREKVAKIVVQIKGLKARQDKAIVESARIHKEVLRQKRFPLELLRSLQGLKNDRQAGLATETASLGKKLEGAHVFAHILGKTVTAMKNATQRMQQRLETARDRQERALTQEEIAQENQADAETQKYQKEASRRLDRLLEALKNEGGGTPKPPQNRDPPPGGEQGGQGGSPPPANRDGIPTLAELKALKAEQEEVNQRTTDFDEHHPELAKLPAEQKLDKLQGKDRQELQEIKSDQEKVRDLAQQLLAAAKKETKEGDQP